MVTYRQYMSVALDECGNDRETFEALASLWSDQKDAISEMSKREVRQNLECP